MPRYDDDSDAWSSASTTGVLDDYRKGVDYRNVRPQLTTPRLSPN